MNKRQVQDAMNKGFSHLEFTANHKREVLSKLKGEKPVKKKLSVGLVFAIVLMLAAVTALAIVHFNEYGRRIAGMEAEKGYYDTWPAEDRISLIGILVESGVLPEDDRVNTLFSGTLDDAEASALATEIITDWGILREDVITLISILEKVKGPMGHWSPEDKAWYTDVLHENGKQGVYDFMTPIMPTGDGLSQVEAEKIAFDAIVEAYQFDPMELAAYKVGSVFYTIPNLDTEAKWFITFYPPAPDGGHKAESGLYVVIDHKTGEVIADPHAGYETPAQRVAKMEITPEQMRERDALYDTKGHHFYWSHEERALYLPDRFSIPDADAITEEEAIRIAWETARNHEQVIPERLVGYNAIAMYSPVNPDVYEGFSEPHWSIILTDQKDTNDTSYRGAINISLGARSGEVLELNGWGDAYIFPEVAR